MEKQLIDIRKSYHQNYVKLNSNACEAIATNHNNNLQPSAKDNQINQIKTNSKKSNNKSNLGATTDDMYHYLMPLLQKQPDNFILHVGTNDASSCNSSEIVNNILKLRSFISQKLPNANIILSKPIIRSNTAAGKVTIEEVTNS